MMAGVDEALRVREAGPLDVPVIAVLHARCFEGGDGGAVWSAASIAEILALPGSYGYLAVGWPDPTVTDSEGARCDRDPQPLGFVLARVLAEDAEILSLGVRPARRRRGVARALLHSALGRARQAGASRILLEVAEDNPAARALYAAEGFVILSRRPAYYRRAAGPPATALVFERSLSG